MLYNGVFGCHKNTCYVIFDWLVFCMIHSLGPINVFTDFGINRYKVDEVKKTCNNCMFYLHVLRAHGPYAN